ncbi:M56 family metallopeptidase [Candidatus Latescibacterota bacterium]
MNISSLLSEFDHIGYNAIRILLTVLWQSSIVLVVIGILTYMLRSKKESIRYYLWLTAILVIPLLPFFSWGFAKIGTSQAEIRLIPLYSSPQVRIEQRVPNQETSHKFGTQREHNNEIVDQYMILPEISAAIQSQNSGTNISLMDYLWALVFAVYIITASFLLTLIVIGRIRIRNWIVTCGPVMDSRVIEVFQNVKKRLAISKDIIIIENEQIHAPMACRIFHPTIVMPAGFADKMSDAELNAVAIHELSHIKHKDLFILGIVSFVRAVFFFHPLLWYAAHEVSFLVESSCDNAVLELTDDRFSYVDMLVRIAENLPKKVFKTELSIGIIFSKSMFYRRINCMIFRQREHIRNLSRLVIAVTVATVVISLVTALMLPLVEMHNPDSLAMALSGNEMDKNKLVRGIRWMGGKITDSDGKPVSGASLILTLETDVIREATTDNEGEYRYYGLTGVIAERLTVHHEEYGNFYFNYLSTNQINNFILKKAERFLSGKVVDSDGNPIEGARIETDPFRLESEVIYNDEKTDTAGNFHLKNIFSDNLRVYVSHLKHGYKVYDAVETNKSDVIFTLDSLKDSKYNLSSMPSRPSGSYKTLFIQGQAPVKIDGNLSDWTLVNTKVEHLVKNNPELNPGMRFSFRSPENEDDLSAKVQCFADMNYVYIAADVTDDILLFHNLPFLSTLGVDDTVMIKFHGNKKIRSVTYMWLTCDAKGKPFLEGRDPVTKEPYPYLMESLGVEYALKQTGDGYSMEIAVPWSVLKMGGLGPEDYMGINIWLFDRDNRDIPHARKMVCWALKGINDFIEIDFSESKSGIDSRAPNNILYESDSFERINNVLQCVKIEDWETAEKHLKSYDDEPWVKPMLAIVQGKAGKKDEMVNTLIEVMEKTPHLRAEWWAEDHVYSYAKTLEMNRQYEEACNILEKITGKNILEKVIGKDLSYSAHYDSRLALGYNYFMSGSYVNAKKTLEEFLKSEELAHHDSDSQLVSQAHQLLSSIDRMVKN